MDDLLQLHGNALDDAIREVTRVDDDQLTARTPCAEWDLAALLAHMIGQHLGFALAVENGIAPASAYAPKPWTRAEWTASVDRVRSAFAAADPDATVLQVELHPTRALPMATVIGAQLLDTAVHTWDVARSLGLEYTPEPAIKERVLQIAAGIPDGANRTAPGAAFAPGTGSATSGPDNEDQADPWQRCLALLGREY